ncbi:MAG: relaxase domain-containing protein, partial [Actinomycetota bacterium]|nr:relaxase domain-containing protein [Actinomycetota bacterium]
MPKAVTTGNATVVLACHQEAVADVVAFLERHAAFVRGPGGRVAATGLTAAVWDHRTARDGAPLLLSHITIVNAAVGVDGRRAALDGTALYAWARAAGHVHQAGLRPPVEGAGTGGRRQGESRRGGSSGGAEVVPHRGDPQTTPRKTNAPVPSFLVRGFTRTHGSQGHKSGGGGGGGGGG